LAVDLKNYVNNDPEDFLVMAAGMIHADHLVEKGEIKYCHKLITEMYGSSVKLEEFEDVVNSYSKEKLNHALNNYIKHYENLEHNDDDEYLIIGLIILGLSDLHIDPDEISYLEYIGNALDISNSEISKLITKTEDFAINLKLSEWENSFVC